MKEMQCCILKCEQWWAKMMTAFMLKWIETLFPDMIYKYSNKIIFLMFQIKSVNTLDNILYSWTYDQWIIHSK